MNFQSLSPGVTLTDASEKSLRSYPETKFLRTEDVADALIYILGTPPNVQVNTFLGLTKSCQLISFEYIYIYIFYCCI